MKLRESRKFRSLLPRLQQKFLTFSLRCTELWELPHRVYKNITATAAVEKLKMAWCLQKPAHIFFSAQTSDLLITNALEQMLEA